MDFHETRRIAKLIAQLVYKDRELQVNLAKVGRGLPVAPPGEVRG